MTRTARAAGVAVCLGLSLILVGSALGTGDPAGVALPVPLPAETGGQPSTPPGQTTPVANRSTKPPAGALPADQAITELRGRGKNPSAMVVNAAGVVESVTAAPGKTLAGGTGDAFVRRYAAGFGAGDTTTLTAGTPTVLPGGDTVTRYQQTIGGLPVMGGELIVTATAAGGVRGAVSALSGYSPKAATSMISSVTARTTAIKAITERYAIDAALIDDVTVRLWLYDPTTMGAPGTAGLRPTYWVAIGGADGRALGDVLVDAQDGSVRLAASEHRTVAPRRVCDLANKATDLRYVLNYRCATPTALAAQASSRAEGGAASSVPDVNAAYNNLGAARDFYLSTFGLDSFDGRGTEIAATVRVCDSGMTCSDVNPYDNAFWDGKQVNFGAGWAVDDVVAHEFTHAVTEHSSNLFYWYEPGAINEALSDIMSQFVDLRTPADDMGTKRWLLGEDLPQGAIRSMSSPNSYNAPASYWDYYWWSETLTSEMDNGGVHTNSGVANKLASLLADGGSLNGSVVGGIGLPKSEQLWYRVMHLLPSGADYRELRVVLNAACLEFVGHRGFTTDDCAQVRNAANAVQLPTTAEREEGDYYCPTNAYEPPGDLFFDDFEHGAGKWRRSSTYYWALLPNQDIPYSYAASGQGSLNGWTTNTAGHGQTAEMSLPVALPVGKSSYLHFDSSMINEGYVGKIATFIQSDGGPWTPLTRSEDRFTSGFQGAQINGATRGYTSLRYDLSAYKGHSVKVRFQVNSSNGAFVDWYVDDVRIYTCDGRPSAPNNVVAYQAEDGLHLQFDPPSYLGNPGMYWDITYSPVISGAPGTIGGSSAENIVLANATPGIVYTITVAGRNSYNGLFGTPVTVKTDGKEPLSCPTPPLSPFTLPVTRPAPVANTCHRPPVGRRW